MEDLDYYKNLLSVIEDTPEGYPLIFYAWEGYEVNKETTIKWLKNKIEKLEKTCYVPQFQNVSQTLPNYVPLHDPNFPSHIPPQPSPKVVISPLSI